MMIELNINEQIMVRLTDRGRRALMAAHFADHYRLGFDTAMALYTPPDEDEEGWSTWSMWDMMRTVGPHIVLGSPPPIETTIRII